MAEEATDVALDAALLTSRADVAALQKQIRVLEDTIVGLRSELATAKTLAEQQAAGLVAQAQKLREAQRLRREAELHAAAVVLQADPDFDPAVKSGAATVRSALVEVSPATSKALNPETKVEVHEHSDSCSCDEADGRRVSVTVQPVAERKAN